MGKRYLWVDNQPLSMFRDEKNAFHFEERALLVANSGDMIILDYQISKEYLHLLDSLLNRQITVLCIEPRYNDLVESILKWKCFDLLKEYVSANDFIIRAYIPDDRIRLLSEAIGIKVLGYEMYKENNTQIDLYTLREKLGLNQINTILINGSQIDSIRDFCIKNESFICKPNASIGGKNVCVFEKKIDGEEFLHNLSGDYVLQERIPSDLEGSIQFIRNCDDYSVYICQTKNPNYSYSGFYFPFYTSCSYQLKKDSDKILHYILSSYGDAADSFGIDFIISRERIYYHDLNPRKTAVTYVMSFLEKLYGGIGRVKGFKTVCNYFYIKEGYQYSDFVSILSNLKIGLGNLSKYEGIIVISPSTISDGLLQLVSVSISGNELKYLNLFQKDLSEKGIV